MKKWFVLHPRADSRARSFVKSRRSGAILFIAVGAIAVLSILVLGTTSSVLQELKLARFIVDTELGFYPALSANELMSVLWANDPTPQIFSSFDARPREISLGPYQAKVFFIDEQSRLHVSRATREAILRLPGMSLETQLVDQMRGMNALYKEEFASLEAMTPELYEGISDLITTFGDGSVNVHTAVPEVLETLGMDDELVEKIASYLAGEDEEPGTVDDGVFTSGADIPALLEAKEGLNPFQRTILTDLVSAGQLGVQTSCVRLKVEVYKSGLLGKEGARPIKIYTIVRELPQGQIFFWDEA